MHSEHLTKLISEPYIRAATYLAALPFDDALLTKKRETADRLSEALKQAQQCLQEDPGTAYKAALKALWILDTGKVAGPDFDELGSAVFDDLHERIIAVRSTASARLTKDVRDQIEEDLAAEVVTYEMSLVQ
jgi:hypothetical protein